MTRLILQNVHGFSLIMGFALLISCRGKIKSEDPDVGKIDSMSVSMFPQVQNATMPTGLNFGSTILTTEISGNYLLMSDARDSFLLHIVDLRNNKLAGRCIRRGKGHGQCLNIASIIPTNDDLTVWVYDITIGKFIEVSLDSAATAAQYIPSREFDLGQYTRNVKSPCYVDDSTFASLSYAHNDFRFIYFSPDSKKIRKVGRLPLAPEQWPQDTVRSPFSFKASIYSGTLRKRPGSPVFVAAYGIFPRLDIYRDDTLYKVKRGPDNFSPDLRFKVEEGRVFFRETKESRKAFLNLKSTQHFVFLLYSGKARDVDHSNTILVMDWNGSPIKKITLDKEIFNFAAQERSKDSVRLYYVDRSNGSLGYSDVQIHGISKNIL